MLKRTVKILTGLLVLQALLFIGLQVTKTKSAQFSATEPFLTLNFEEVDKLTIEDNEDKKVSLVKVDGKWRIPDYWDFPISETKLREVTGKLIGFKVSWPVGKTLIAAKQFNVVDDHFERKIVFYKGETALNTLYLGNSPSFKKVHARVDGSEQTYAIDFNTYDMPSAANNWVDKKFYELPRTDVKTVAFRDIVLENDNGTFKLASLPDDKETDSLKVSPLVTTILNPEFEDVLGKEEALNTNLKEVLAFTVETNKGEKIEYSFREMPDEKKNKDNEEDKPKESEFLALKISAYPYVFKIRRTRVASLINTSRDELMKVKGASDKEISGDKPETKENEMDESSHNNEDSGALNDSSEGSTSSSSLDFGKGVGGKMSMHA